MGQMCWQMVVVDENTVAAALECLFLFHLRAGSIEPKSADARTFKSLLL